MKEVITLLLTWFVLVFFAVLLTVLGFKLAMLVVSNIMGVLV